MKKLYSTIMMLAMMVAALSFTACSSDDDEDGGDNGSMLVLDGYKMRHSLNTETNTYDATITQRYNNMHFSFNYSKDNTMKLYELDLRIPALHDVSNLEVGDTFDFSDIEVETYRNIMSVELYESTFKSLGGSITITNVTNKEVTAKINDFKFSLDTEYYIDGDFYSPSNPKIHVLSGTAKFHNSLYRDDEGWLPFY